MTLGMQPHSREYSMETQTELDEKFKRNFEVEWWASWGWKEYEKNNEYDHNLFFNFK